MSKKRNKLVKVLFVDDVNLILEGYRRIIEKYTFPQVAIESVVTTTCDAAWEKIQSDTIHLVILDLNFSLNSIGKMESGEALGINIRTYFPDIKLIILTGVIDKDRIDHVIKKLNPEGVLIKGETNSREIFESLKIVLAGKKHYSPYLFHILESK